MVSLNQRHLDEVERVDIIVVKLRYLKIAT